jgi:hypothetical protein
VPSSAKASTWQPTLNERPRAASSHKSEGSDSVYSFQIPDDEIDYDSDGERQAKRRVTMEPSPKANSKGPWEKRKGSLPPVPKSASSPWIVHSQQPKLGCSAAAQPPEPTVSSKPSAQATTMMAQLRELIQMRKDGNIDDGEFKEMKAALTRRD